MEKLISVVVIGAALIFVSPLFGVLTGAFTGWVVGFFFSSDILGVLHRMGMQTDGLSMWQLGAFAGFFGGFVRVFHWGKAQ